MKQYPHASASRMRGANSARLRPVAIQQPWRPPFRCSPSCRRSMTTQKARHALGRTRSMQCLAADAAGASSCAGISKRYEDIVAAFEKQFGAPPEALARAPGGFGGLHQDLPKG